MTQSNHDTAWDLLKASVMNFNGNPIGTVAARDTVKQELNYDQVFVRDFAVSAYIYLLADEPEIVANFLLEMVRLQRTSQQFDCFEPGEGLMPASFKVEKVDGEQRIIADFGERAIARVPPVDSGLWWMLLLHAYVQSTGDRALAERADVQGAIRILLDLYLSERFDMFPTILVPDGSFMIDRRMGVYGYPVDVQALFFASLKAVVQLLVDSDENNDYITAARARIEHLAYHIRTYYWLDLEKLNHIYRYDVEEYGEHTVNIFNIYPETIPGWLIDWIPESGGYFAGNIGPARMDYRYFAHGNLMAIISGLATDEQAQAFMELLRARWDDLVGHMPLKLVFPALQDRDWVILTGMDPKNRAWSYHNGRNWPSLVWLLAAACVCTGAFDILERALDELGSRLSRDNWPEYYDGQYGRLVGREARVLQTWSIAGFLVAEHLAEHPQSLERIGFASSGPYSVAGKCQVPA